MSTATGIGDTAGRGGALAGPVAAALREAQQWLGEPVTGAADAAPTVARRLRDRGASAVCIVGVAGADGRLLHWLDTQHARGWIAPAEPAVGVPQPRAFADQWKAAIDKGFVAADAAVIATMALAAGGKAGFINDPRLLPCLSWGEAPRFAAPATARAPHRLGLYAIVDSAERLQQVLAAGVKTVQLRIKEPPAPDDFWRGTLRREVERSIHASRASGAELYVNDQWQLAAELGAFGVHLGQEDIAAMSEERRAAVLASGLALGASSHSLWELARAAGGRLVRGDASARVDSLATDTRRLEAGQAFWALVGERVDAHSLLGPELAAKASGWVVQKGRLPKDGVRPAGGSGSSGPAGRGPSSSRPTWPRPDRPKA